MPFSLPQHDATGNGTETASLPPSLLPPSPTERITCGIENDSLAYSHNTATSIHLPLTQEKPWFSPFSWAYGNGNDKDGSRGGGIVDGALRSVIRRVQPQYEG